MDLIKKTFSIRSKILVIVFLNVLTLVGFVYLGSVTIISKSYLNIEKDETVDNLQRVNDTINYDNSQLTSKAKDWAFWDDTYKFAQDKNQEYIDSNLGVLSISNIKINLMAFFDADGKLIFKRIIDLDNVTEADSESVNSVISKIEALTIHKNIDSIVEGIIMLPEGPLLVSSVPILTSQIKGPIKGSLILGVFLNNKMISSLSDVTHLSLSLYDFNSTYLPQDVSSAKLEISKGKDKSFVLPSSEDVVSGYQILDDIHGDPVLILKIDTPRDVYHQGQTTSYIFIIISVICIILFGVALVFLIKKFIVSRILLLSKEVETVNTTGNLGYKVKEGAMDEIGILAKIINNTFQSLIISQKTEKEALEKNKEINKELEIRLGEMEKMNKLMVGRELAMIEMKEKLGKLEKSS